MKTRPKIIAIDGPAGSGKSTIASLVSKTLGWDYLNTGVLYRLIGFLAQKSNLSLESDEQIAQLIRQCEKDIEWVHGVFYYQKRDVSLELQGERFGGLASAVGKSKTVRELLLPIQRKLALNADKGVIIDGRDIGTVVFPHADLKLFMTADLESRAKRRYKQVAEQKISPLPSLEDLIKDIRERDLQDTVRSHSPLQKASDALDFDTSGLSIEECVRKIVALIQERT